MPRGTYNTRQKARILGYLSEHKGQRLTVDEVARQLAGDGQSVGKTTVYRQLEALAGQGAVLKYADAEGETCYQYCEDASGCDGHSHVVCTGCGELLHLDCALLQTLDEHMRCEHGFALDAGKTVLYGRCARCAEEKEKR